MTKRGQLNSDQMRRGGALGGAGLALAALVSFLAVWEGKSNDPYRDVVNVPTVCYGETNVPMRRYTDEECLQMLRASAQRYMAGVMQATPGIENDPLQLAAHAELAYNIGIEGYRRSSVRRLYLQGREVDACNFLGRYNRAGRRVWRGLHLRRQGDAARLGSIELCLTIPPEPFDAPTNTRRN